MNSIMQYPDKGYDVEIWYQECDILHPYVADIKHPCGELVTGIENIRSQRDAVYWAVTKINELPEASQDKEHDCDSEYCEANRYLRNFKNQ